MALSKIVFKDETQLKEHIKTHTPTFYMSSGTSTVIPYDKLAEIYKDSDFVIGDLSQLSPEMTLLNNGDLKIKGAVNWKDANDFLKQYKRVIKTAPTEDLALIIAGAATSATGERCFHFGNFRSQIKEISYLNYNGEKVILKSENEFPKHYKNLYAFQNEYSRYEDFKNAPYPRFEKETDLLIGTEGQLGVITDIVIETALEKNVQHLFLLLPKWEDSPESHIEVINKVQAYRSDLILCELIDSNSFNYLPENERPNKNKDAIFFEVFEDKFEHFYETFLSDLSFLDENEVFELNATKFHHIRASIPRAVFEENSKMGVVKMGTDVQVKTSDFHELLEIYKSFTKIGVNYNLFGHFGDAHLHFNFMPKKDQTNLCKEQFEKMYERVLKLSGSPFAEHGIGIIKQKFIQNFWNNKIYDMFSELKKEHDPHSQFFPQGFMSLEKK